MPKLKGRIPRVNIRAVAPIKLTDEHWKTIEAAYGYSIHPEAREQIAVVTDQFLELAQAEKNVGLMDDAVERAGILRESAQSVIDAINNRPIGDNTRQYVDDEIALRYSLLKTGDFAKRVPTRNYVSWLCLELSRFVGACEEASRQLADASGHDYWQEGAAWEIWIRGLTSLLKAYRLPTGARKDTERRESLLHKASPFVELVRALQVHIPDEYAPTNARGALAEGISKARTESKSKSLVVLRKPPARKSGRNKSTTIA
jgi:hypothetical protein